MTFRLKMAKQNKTFENIFWMDKNKILSGNPIKKTKTSTAKILIPFHE